MGQKNKKNRCALTVPLLLAALALPACVTTKPLTDIVDAARDTIDQVRGNGGQQATAATDTTNARQRSTATAQPPAPALAYSSSPTRMRAEPQLDKFFADGTVNGKELIDELKAIKAAADSRRTEETFVALMGAIDASASNFDSVDRFDWKALLKNIGMAGFRQVRGAISYAALDHFMDTLIRDPEALAKESVSLPAPQGLDRAQMQRVLNMAAFVVGARVANRVAEDADDTWQNLEGEYEKLLDRREKAARLLADAVDLRRKAQLARDEARIRQTQRELSRWLSDADIRFIDEFGAGKPIKLGDFANDFAMQNIALEYMRRRDPSAYREYRADADGLIGRTKAYVQTAGGALAFGGLVASFANEASMFIDDRDLRKILRVLPLGAEFVEAAIPLAYKTFKAAHSGVIVESSSWNPFNPEKRFRVLSSAGSEDVTASGAFDLIKGSGRQNLFRSGMFSASARGFLHRVYQCDPETTGRMLDTAIPDAMRAEFGESFLNLPKGSEFHFVNALTKDAYPRRRQLVSNMLVSDQRRSGRFESIGDMQRQVDANYASWNDSQLARLILANHHGSVSHAQMQIGDSMIRLIPTITAVYEYESYADSCRRSAGGA